MRDWTIQTLLPFKRRLNLLIQSLIVLSLISFSIQTLPNVDLRLQKALDYFELVSVAIFSTEYLLRIVITKNPLKYLLSFYGLTDLLAIAPFYLATSIDLRSIRIFRLFRLFRIFKLLKYNEAINRVSEAFKEIKNELVVFGVATLFLLYISAVGIYYFENPVQPEKFKSVFHSMWWAVTTLTTVGYGDMYPMTVGGKIFTSIIVFIGMGTIAVPTGLFATAFSKTYLNDRD